MSCGVKVYVCLFPIPEIGVLAICGGSMQVNLIMERNMAYITQRTETLTDGSKVFNVLVYSDYDTLVIEFHCVTEKDASEFEAKLYCAIQDHTVDVVVRRS
jgi:hypothetical protein